MKKNSTGVLLALTGCALTVPAMLQADEATNPNKRVLQMEEVVVSVRKRSDNIQDIPISVQAFSAEDMQRQGLNELSDVANLSPSVTFDQGADPTAVRIGIRGLLPSRGRQNVAILMDGIDVGTEALGAAGGGMILNSRLADIERIEVVKGPQSALFGRSAFAGAIQYVTKDPSDELETTFSTDVGNKGRYSASVGVSGPLIDDVLGARLNATYWNKDGFYKDAATGSDLGGSEGKGVALSLKWTPTESTSFKFRTEYTTADYDQQADVLLRSNTGKLNITNDPLLMAIEAEEPSILSTSSVALFRGDIPDGDDIGRPQLSPNPHTGKVFPGSERDIFRASLISAWDVGVGTITSYTSYTDVDGSTLQDSDGDADLVDGIDVSRRGSVLDFDSTIEQFSQELRFSSSFDGPVQVTFGGLYWTEDAKRLSRTVGANCGSVTSATDVCNLLDLSGGREESSAELVRQSTVYMEPTLRDIEHWSAYGLVEWELTEQFKLSFETRYNREEEEVVAPNCDLELVAALKGSVSGPCEDPLSASTSSMFGPSTIVHGLQNAAMYGVPYKVKTKSDWWTPRFTAEWKPQDHTLYYFSMAKGVKPAGTTTLLSGSWFDADFDGTLDERSYEAEKMWAYELGMKKTWGGSLLTNVAVFFQDYTDKQVTTSMVSPSGNVVPVIENAGKAEVWGLELEAMWQATDNLSLGLGYTYLDTEYTDYRELTDSASRIVRAGNCTVVMLPDGSYTCEVDLTGNELEKAPKHAAIGRLIYEQPVSSLDATVSFEMDVIYQGERYVSQENYHTLGDYTMANFRFGVAKDNWRAVFYVDNAFDDDTVKAAAPKTGSVDQLFYQDNPNPVRSSTAILSVDLPDPRTYGIRFSMHF